MDIVADTIYALREKYKLGDDVDMEKWTFEHYDECGQTFNEAFGKYGDGFYLGILIHQAIRLNNEVRK